MSSEKGSPLFEEIDEETWKEFLQTLGFKTNYDVQKKTSLHAHYLGRFRKGFSSNEVTLHKIAAALKTSVRVLVSLRKPLSEASLHPFKSIDKIEVEGKFNVEDKIGKFQDYIEEKSKDYQGRKKLRKQVDAFIQQSDQKLFILVAEPGAGKTTFLARLIKDEQYVHYFIKKRGFAPYNPEDVVWSIGAQLAKKYHQHYDAITMGDLGIQTTGTPPSVFMRPLQQDNLWNLYNALVIEPLKSIAKNLPDEKIVIIIDALNESSALNRDNDLVHLFSRTDDLPSNIRFIFSTQPDPQIFSTFNTDPVFLDKDENTEDIKEFIHFKLNQGPISELLHKEKFHPQDVKEKIAIKSDENFLYLDLFFRDIIHIHQTQSDFILKDYIDKVPKGLDDYYVFLLNNILQDNNLWKTDFCPILGTLSAAQSSLTYRQISDFSGLPLQVVYDTIPKLATVLRVDEYLNQELFDFYHNDFSIFLTNEKRNRLFLVDAKEYHTKISRHYIDQMDEDREYFYSDSYFIDSVSYHLFEAGMYKEIFSIVTTKFLINKKRYTGSRIEIINDLSYAFEAAWEKKNIVELSKYLLLLNAHTEQKSVLDISSKLLLNAKAGEVATAFDGIIKLHPGFEKAWLLAGMITLISDDKPELLEKLSDELMHFFESHNFWSSFEEAQSIILFVSSTSLEIGFKLALKYSEKNTSTTSSQFNFFASDDFIYSSTDLKKKLLEVRVRNDVDGAIADIIRLEDLLAYDSLLDDAIESIAKVDVSKAYETCHKFKSIYWKSRGLLEVGNRAGKIKSSFFFRILDDLQGMIDNSEISEIDEIFIDQVSEIVGSVNLFNDDTIETELRTNSPGLIRDLVLNSWRRRKSDDLGIGYSEDNKSYFSDKEKITSAIESIEIGENHKARDSLNNLKNKHLKMLGAAITYLIKTDSVKQLETCIDQEYSGRDTEQKILDPFFEGDVLFALGLWIIRKFPEEDLGGQLIFRGVNYCKIKLCDANTFFQNFNQYLIKVYMAKPELAISLFDRIIGPLFYEQLYWMRTADRTVFSFLDSVKDDHKTLNEGLSFLKTFISAQEHEGLRRNWELELLSNNPYSSASENIDIFRSYFEAKEFNDKLSSWYCHEYEIDISSNFVSQIVKQTDEECFGEVLRWLTERHAGFSVAAIGCLKAAKESFSKDPRNAQYYANQGVSIIAQGYRIHHKENNYPYGWEMTTAYRALSLFLRDCKWAMTSQMIENINEIQEKGDSWQALQLSGNIAESDFEGGLDYLTSRTSGDADFENLRKGFAYIVCRSCLSESIDSGEVENRIYSITQHTSRFLNLMDKIRDSPNRNDILRTAFNGIAQHEFMVAVDLIRNDDPSIACLDIPSLLGDLIRNANNKEKIDILLMMVERGNRSLQPQQQIVLAAKCKLNDYDGWQVKVEEAFSLLESNKIDDVADSGLCEILLTGFERGISKDSMGEIIDCLIPCFEPNIRRWAYETGEYSDDKRKERKINSIFEHDFAKGIGYIKELENQNKDANLDKINLSFSINGIDRAHDLIDKINRAELKNEHKTHFIKQILNNTHSDNWSSLLELAECIDSDIIALRTKIEILEKSLHVQNDCNAEIQKIESQIDICKSRYRCELRAQLGRVVSKTDPYRANKLFGVALKQLVITEKPQSGGDYRLFILHGVFTEWVKASLPFEEELFKKFFECATMYQDQSAFGGLNIASFYLLASKCEEHGEIIKYKICCETIDKFDHMKDSLSVSCLPLIYDCLKPNTYDVCLANVVSHFQTGTFQISKKEADIIGVISPDKEEYALKVFETISDSSQKFWALINLGKAHFHSDKKRAEDYLWKAFWYSVEQGMSDEHNYEISALNLYKVRDVSAELLYAFRHIGNAAFECLPIIFIEALRSGRYSISKDLWKMVVTVDEYLNQRNATDSP